MALGAQGTPEPAAPVGPADRVAIVQRQARATLSLAFVFVLGSAFAAVVPHDTGRWLGLHLFLIGGLGLAISGASQLFAVTWASGPPPSSGLSAIQRGLVAGGALVVALGRELDVPDGVVAAAGGMVATGFAVLGVMLWRSVRRGVQRRFDPSLRWYLVALACGLVGVVAGDVLATASLAQPEYAQVRNAHITLNLLGLVGLVVAGTLPFFTATEARVKMSRRASPRAQTALLVWLAGSVAVASAGALADLDAVLAGGLASYALGIVSLLSVVPRLGAKQVRWAGPRLVQLGVGIAWWVATVAAAAARAADGRPPFSGTIVGVLVIGAYAQVLAGALAYLVPVLRGGGHVRLSSGFATTRSLPGLVAANVAAIAIAFGATTVAAFAVAVWLLDATARGVVFVLRPLDLRRS